MELVQLEPEDTFGTQVVLVAYSEGLVQEEHNPFTGAQVAHPPEGLTEASQQTFPKHLEEKHSASFEQETPELFTERQVPKVEFKKNPEVQLEQPPVELQDKQFAMAEDPQHFPRQLFEAHCKDTEQLVPDVCKVKQDAVDVFR